MPRKRFRSPRPLGALSSPAPLVVDVVGRGPTRVPTKVAARLRARYPDAESMARAFERGAIYWCACCDRFRCTEDPERRG